MCPQSNRCTEEKIPEESNETVAGIRPFQADMPGVPPWPLCTVGNANASKSQAPTCSLPRKSAEQIEHHPTAGIPEKPVQLHLHLEKHCKESEPSKAPFRNVHSPGMLATPGNHNASKNKHPATHPTGNPTEPEENQTSEVTERQSGVGIKLSHNNSQQGNKLADNASRANHQSPTVHEQATNKHWTKEHQAGNQEQPEDPAKQQDAARQNIPGMLATPGDNNASFAATETGGTLFPGISQQGGVMGFETNKRRKQTTDQETHPAKKPCTEMRPADIHHSGTATGNQQAAADVTAEAASTKHAEASQSKIKVWIIHENEKAPQETWVQQGTTAGQITQAEANLGVMTQPIAARSWVNSPLPLYDQVIDKQVIKLCRDLDMPRCPFVAGSCTVPKIEFPCPRIYALWAQQAFVAIDEMDFLSPSGRQRPPCSCIPSQVFSIQKHPSKQKATFGLDHRLLPWIKTPHGFPQPS